MKSACADVRLKKLNLLLDAAWEQNSFYSRKWREAGVNAHHLSSLKDLAKFPFTTRDELLADQNAAPPLGTNLTCAPADCKRIHHSSGTTRAPLYWADTAQSWQWVARCSQALYELAGITTRDRIFFTIPPGASSGGWILHEGATRLGCCCFTASRPKRMNSCVGFKVFSRTSLLENRAACSLWRRQRGKRERTPARLMFKNFC